MKLKYLSPLFALYLAACAIVAPARAPAGPSPTFDAPSILATPTYPATPPPSATFAPTTSHITALGLSGKMIYTQGLAGLWQIDLSTGAQTQLWKLPDKGYIAGVAASPDGTRLALTYAAPPPDGTPQLGSTDLYLASGDGSNRQPLLQRTGQYESYINPLWSPDGKWIYVTHYKPLTDDKGTFTGLAINIEKIAPDGGTPQLVLAGAQQPSLSADATRMAYLRFDLQTYAQGLWIANADGSEAKELVPDSAFYSLVGPRLSPDGTTIAFGASGPLQTSQRPGFRLTDWFGVKVAEAHGPPWEVWEVSAEGGPPKQLTHLFTDGPWTAWSPDGKHLAALQPGGVLLLGEGDPVFLGPAAGHGEMIWIP